MLMNSQSPHKNPQSAPCWLTAPQYLGEVSLPCKALLMADMVQIVCCTSPWWASTGKHPTCLQHRPLHLLPCRPLDGVQRKVPSSSYSQIKKKTTTQATTCLCKQTVTGTG